MPGTEPAEACRVVLGELPELPYLPELPARGPHADLTGRATALLVDLYVDLQPSGWRVTSRPGRDSRLARDLLARDLDALEETAAQAPPALLKVQAAGPWTLAATVELHRGDRMLADPAAVRDLTASLAEGLRLQLADLGRRLPSTTMLLQLDEPALPAVLDARIATASGFDRIRAPDGQVARDRLAEVLGVAPLNIIHCCTASPPVALLRAAGAGSLSLDMTQLREHDDDAIGEAVESGAGLLLGVLPAVDNAARGSGLSDLDAMIAPVAAMWRRLGFAPEELARTVVLTPTCGLAGASPGYPEMVLRAGREMGRRLREAPE